MNDKGQLDNTGIILGTVATITAVTGIAFGAYHMGKRHAQEEIKQIANGPRREIIAKLNELRNSK